MSAATTLQQQQQISRQACSSSNRSRRTVVVRAQAPAAAPTTVADAPLMVRAARGEEVERAPCWMMRQAGRYQAAYRELAKKHPSFRERSETTELIVDISLQPWRSFKPDGVILFSDILTPLPGIGVPFEIDDNKGPLLDNTIRSREQLKVLHSLDLSQLQFVGDSLKLLRQEVGSSAAVLGESCGKGEIALAGTSVICGSQWGCIALCLSLCHCSPHQVYIHVHFILTMCRIAST
eukprot:GHUV01014746.1.p1 GENE.GHUV01014746.1~~GHUV01014746.1.p1  ORF type:complete len:236 (+),score=58.39 GHUV01014746.1:253-960(+)